MSAVLPKQPRFAAAVGYWLVLGAAAVLIVIGFWEPIQRLIENWLTRPEYSHGLVIPIASAYLVWQRRSILEQTAFTGSWFGFLIALAGLLLWLTGELSTIFAVTQFALVVVIAGTALSLTGLHGYRHLIVPILLLLLAIPLPRFIYNNFSSELQLLSSQLGVAVLRLSGVSVYLEGNVIDLGHFQMQVVEACDGLRYLFPMMTLGLIVAYFFRGPAWQKALLFVFTIPVTIVMNSVRIAMIGWFAEHGNTALAEGLLHDVQGWAMFMLSAAFLMLLVYFFWRMRSERLPWAEAFAFAEPSTHQRQAASRLERTVPLAFVATVIVLVAGAAAAFAIPSRTEVTPAREFCVLFPMSISQYAGKREALESEYFDALKVDDYVLANYRTQGDSPINLFVAYYGSQRKGESVHSPRSCLPGGGWKIDSIGRYALAGEVSNAVVNRAVIQMGNRRQLVYYWFKQRDRWLTSELAVKWYIFRDALLRNRSDGALVRLVTPVPEGESLEAADRRLSSFAREVSAELPRFVPD
ncbi:MAG: VPLPA-CTERM-specific exosortase XrtD [Pseudomonadota bacterium]